MTNILLLVTQVSSLFALILVLVAIIITFISFSKFSGESSFKRSVFFLGIYLVFFMLAIAFMSLYHWLGSGLMEILWYITLNLSLLFGIISGGLSLSFWKKMKLKTKS